MILCPKIPVSVVVMTLNEEVVIGRCLRALQNFREVFVVDSGSTDNTVSLAAEAGACVVPFKWNGLYPKKKQWCLTQLPFKYDWVFMVDADEVVTSPLVREMRSLFLTGSPSCAGYFVKGRNIVNGKALRFGLFNNKLMLLDRHKLAFPVVDELDIQGGIEVEAHYQPVLKSGCEKEKIGRLKAPLLHYIHESGEDWETRHKRYAQWEAGMNRKKSWPEDPVRWRQVLKILFRTLPGRPLLAFLHCYIAKGGFLDGLAGWRFARDRFHYYHMINRFTYGDDLCHNVSDRKGA